MARHRAMEERTAKKPIKIVTLTECSECDSSVNMRLLFLFIWPPKPTRKHFRPSEFLLSSVLAQLSMAMIQVIFFPVQNGERTSGSAVGHFTKNVLLEFYVR